MRGEDFTVGEGDGFRPARARPERIDQRQRSEIEDVDLLNRRGVEISAVHREAADLRRRRLEIGNAEMRDRRFRRGLVAVVCVSRGAGSDAVEARILTQCGCAARCDGGR